MHRDSLMTPLTMTWIVVVYVLPLRSSTTAFGKPRSTALYLQNIGPVYSTSARISSSSSPASSTIESSLSSASACTTRFPTDTRLPSSGSVTARHSASGVVVVS
eukprot:CAMPEP_0180270546 /NCGR_PEP_ID=MMETSP0988-20121125/3243_1 /TAXON_ID=697907 /ORGANISM="non described non described, Strain CCMP2293" /LENGTH=103 /DNA_ID=CAMNT_0022241505 /DNA_START=16 /DNA_END=327 /DNA_ORIENTATION=-